MRARDINIRIGEKKRAHARNRLVSMCRCTYLHEKFLVVNCYFVSLSLKFHKDPSISGEDIPLFVTPYNLEHKNIRYFTFKIRNYLEI